MHTFIELDGVSTLFQTADLQLDGSDFFILLNRTDGRPLELAGEVRGERLRLDLRALDDVLGALQGFAVTTYPGGENVCEAFLEVTHEGKLTRLHTDFTFAWDKHIDPPGRVYPEPRRVRMQLMVSWPKSAA